MIEAIKISKAYRVDDIEKEGERKVGLFNAYFVMSNKASCPNIILGVVVSLA